MIANRRKAFERENERERGSKVELTVHVSVAMTTHSLMPHTRRRSILLFNIEPLTPHAFPKDRKSRKQEVEDQEVRKTGSGGPGSEGTGGEGNRK